MQNGIPQILTKGCVRPYTVISSDLVDGKKRFIHNWGIDPRNIVIHAYTDQGIAFTPDKDGGSDFNSIVIDFSGLTITNVWTVILISDGDYTRVTDTIPFGICQTYISGSASNWQTGKSSDLTGLTSLSICQADGDMISLWYNGTWAVYPFDTTTLALSTMSLINIKMYDVFAYWTGTAVAFELCVWGTYANGTDHRITSLTRQNGILVKTGDPSRRYIGTFYYNNATNDATSYRMVYNYYNQLDKVITIDNSSTYSYSTATWRAMPNSTVCYIVSGTYENVIMQAASTVYGSGSISAMCNGSVTPMYMNMVNLLANSVTPSAPLVNVQVGMSYYSLAEKGPVTVGASTIRGTFKC